MTEGLISEEAFNLLTPETVSPGLVFLVSPDAPSRKVLGAGGGSFAIYKGFETDGVNLLPNKLTPEGVAEAWAVIDDERGMKEFHGGFEQVGKFALKGANNLGIDVS
jgi:hypothetical protein